MPRAMTALLCICTATNLPSTPETLLADNPSSNRAGSSEKHCGNCHGLGLTFCTTCRWEGDLVCDDCKGAGKIRTRDQSGTRQTTCQKCDGTGRSKCPDCGGTGTIVCIQCKNKKRIQKRQTTDGPFPRGQSEIAIHARVGRAYDVHHTDHFFVLYNTNDRILRRFVHRIEVTYDAVHRFATKLEIPLQYPFEKLPIVFCNSYDDFGKAMERLWLGKPKRGFAGFYFQRWDVCIFYNGADADWIKKRQDTADDIRKRARSASSLAEQRRLHLHADRLINRAKNDAKHWNRRLVQHEVAHQLLYNFQVHRRGVVHPRWLREGLATLFEPPPTRRGAGFNVINQDQLRLIREYIEAGRTIPIKELLTNAELFSGTDDQIDRAYAHAWALAFYVTKQKPKAFRKYIDLLNARPQKTKAPDEQEIADFETCFGPLDETFVKRWEAYLTNLPFRPRY